MLSESVIDFGRLTSASVESLMTVRAEPRNSEANPDGSHGATREEPAAISFSTVVPVRYNRAMLSPER